MPTVHDAIARYLSELAPDTLPEAEGEGEPSGLRLVA
jgi:hypothetical protein